jgi:WhiB family redox-sensing transcriptional regulator
VRGDHELDQTFDEPVTPSRPSLVVVPDRVRDTVSGAHDGAVPGADPVRPGAVAMSFDQVFEAVEDDWQERALCSQTDPEAFFPEKGGSTREAKRICTGCEVRDECLEYALAHDERFGIWGGLSERERRRLKRAAVG